MSKIVRNLAAVYRETSVWNTPKVGDEITPGPGQGPPRNLDERMWLAVKIGPDKVSESYPEGQQGELWLAWNEQKGTLHSVSVGYFWVLKEKES